MKIGGGCHCGKVRFSFESPSDVTLLDCNCSICSKSAYLHLFIPHGDFTLESVRDVLTAYHFGSEQADHLFCKNCGIKSFYQPRSHPEAWSVNFRCLDPGHGIEPTIVPFDGKNWEKSHGSLLNKSDK